MLNCLLQSIQLFGKCLIIFCMFHDQSAVEPWFNTNADMVADNRYDYSLMALHLVHDHMRRGGRCAVVITIAQLHLTKPELGFKPCSRRVGDSWWWGSLTIVPAGNKAKRLSSVNHTTKTIHSSSSMKWALMIWKFIKNFVSL